MKALRSIVVILILVAVAGCRQETTQEVKRDMCVTNLLRIQAGKEFLYSQKGKETNYVPVMVELADYIGGTPVCPDNGTYTIGPICKAPTCSVAGHELPPDRLKKGPLGVH